MLAALHLEAPGALPDSDATARLTERLALLERKNRALESRNRQLELKVQRLADLVYTDPLTGLANRRYFSMVLDAEVRRALRTSRPLALLLCDIDLFKQHNDTFGHAHGDAVLAGIGALLKTFCRRGGDCAARYGGEEFVLLMPNTSCSDALAVAERLRQEVAALVFPGDPSSAPPQVTVSVGLTTLADFGSSRRPAELVETADRALYCAKRAGRNTIKHEGLRMVGDAGIEPAASPV